MEAVAAKIANAAESLSFVGGHDTLCGIFDYQQIVAFGNIHNGVHLAGNAGIMYRNDGSGLVSDGIFNQSFVNV